jgi:hypothetical protein
MPAVSKILRRAAAAALAVTLLIAPAASANPTIPAGATTAVALPASNIVTTCTPPGEFHPNPTTWVVNPPTVKVSGLTDAQPEAGQIVQVTVPADHSPFQTITISWSGNTTCVSYNGSLTIDVSAALSTSRSEFARAAVPLSRAVIPLAKRIKRAGRNSGRLKPLLADLRRRVAKAAGRFDLRTLSKRSAWTACRRRASTRAGGAQPKCPGAGLRLGQIKAMPKFASDIKQISEYERVMVDKQDAQYAADPGFRANVDHASRLQFKGRSYAQLTPAEKAVVASQFQAETGALDTLLRWVRNAGKSAGGVVFGR